MSYRSLLMLSGAALFIASTATRAQDDESTIRAIPDPEADLPAAVTDDVPFPDEADTQGANQSNFGRSGQGRDQGLATARDAGTDAAESAGDGIEQAQENAASAAQDALANASNAAENSREEFGRSNAPDELPDQVPEIGEVPEDLPAGPPENLPSPPAGD